MDVKLRLKVISFLQYFIWGTWLITLGSYMIGTLKFTGLQVGVVYSTLGISSLITPSLIGIIADRFVPANRLYIGCHYLSGISFILASQATTPDGLFWAMLFNSFVYMPTIVLYNTLCYTYLDQAKIDIIKNFPGIRIFGTIGFIIAMWSISLLKLELSNLQLYIAAITSILLSAYAWILPKCPITNTKKNASWIQILGLDALVLFKRKKTAVFLIFAVLLGAALQITNTFVSPFLHDFSNNPSFKEALGVQYPSILISVSQISEVLFILLIPFFLKRFGIKIVMLTSIIAWTLRFGLLAYGYPSGFGLLLLLLSMIVYGCAFDFFNVSGAMFIDRETDHSIRASGQALFMTMVNGIGAYLGTLSSGYVVDYYTKNGVRDWQNIWLSFAGYTLILAIVFTFVFQYKHSPEKEIS